MGLTNTKSRNINEIIIRLVMCAVGIALIVAMIFALRSVPNAHASIDPGLDSGNATVDRTSVPGQTILKYTTTGTSTFKAPAGVTNVQVLTVGGGGGGGAGEFNPAGDAAGGGGAGEYLNQASFSVTPGVAVGVTVGSGGAGGTVNGGNGGGAPTTAGNGVSGGESKFGSLTARGGGGGGAEDIPGVSGGSGGGAGGHCTNSGTVDAGGASTAVSPGIGNAGGSSPAGSCSPRGGAGGGGGGAVGTSGSGGSGGVGAIGLQNDITGTNTFYAAGGGGGGGSSSGAGANGGSSIGGKGGNAKGGNGATGVTNTGSGGGGGGTTLSTTDGSGGKGGPGGSGIVVVRFATKTTPDIAGVSGLTMWYKADSAGNTNAQWNDSSTLNYNMTQATATKQPVLTTNSLNFNPAYVFDGTDDVFSMPSGIGSTDSMSAFYAATSTDAAGGDRYLNEFGDDRPSITIYNGKPRLYVRDTNSVDDIYATDASLKPHVYSFVSPNGGGTKIIGVDNKEQTKSITGNYTTGAGATGNTFGSRNVSGGTSWKGPIGEAMFFNRQLTQAERQRVNSYLAIKYGVTLDQGTSGTAYLDSAAATVWPADATYKNAVTGIGRDDGSTLNQKQSKNLEDIVTLGHGTIAASNQANSNNFSSDRSLLLWGHNGAATDQNTAISGTPYVHMNRIWKAVRTNSVGQVQIRIPMSAVTAGNNGVLFVSNSTTFDASSQRTNMGEINGSEYVVNVTLPAGTSYFTFGSLAGADIQFVSKTATDIGGDPITSYTPGESMEYVLTVKNNGPDNAGTVTVTDTLPAGLVPVSATGGGWSCPIAGQTVTCTRPALNTGITAPGIVIEVDIASSVTGSKPNTATASVANDPDTTNNNASLTLTAAPKADLSITKSHTTLPTAGNPHTYNFTVTNNGPSDVTSFTVTDTLDPNLTFTSSTNNICSAVGQNVTCTGGALTASGTGKTFAFDMVVNVSAGYGGGAPIINTGTVAAPAGTTDPNSNNNSSTDTSNILVDTMLGIVKTHTGDFTAGVNNDFKLTVDNQGPSNSPAGSVTVTDILDEDFAFVSAVGTGWSCSDSNDTVTCTNTADIGPGATAPDITLTVLVDSSAKGNATNTAEVSSTTPDSDMSDNSSTNPVTIVSEADLGITKAHVGTAFIAGQEERYTFTVVNNGPSADAPSYTVTDTLPAELTFVPNSSTGDATCSAVGQTVTCTGGGISAGGSAQTFSFAVMVDGSAVNTISNTATIAPAPGTTDPISGNNSSLDNVNVEPNADLSITKQRTGNMTAGADEDYTITVHNGGPSNVTSFTVTDTLDQNLSFVSGAGCSAIDQVVTCTGGVLNSGDDAVIILKVHVESSATPGSTIINTAAVAAPDGVNDPNPSNNDSTANNTVTANADLAVSKTHTGNFTAGANNNTFTISVTNNGPSDAATFTVTDTLQPELTYIDATGTGVDCENAGQTVTCTYGPTISVGQTVDITLTVGVNASQAGNSTIDNTAVVSSTTPDFTPGNNNANDTVTIDSKADLALTKTHSTPDFTAGNNETYSFAVKNNGPSNATSFTLADTLDPNLTYVSATPAICDGSSGQNVTCTGGAIASGDTFTFTVTVAVSPSVTNGTSIDNTGIVATVAPTTDPDPNNNDSLVTTTVVDSTDLSLAKGHVGTFIAGEDAAYTVTVENNGPSDTPANDVTVTDTLPTGMTYVPAGSGGTGWTCNEASGTVTCDYAPVLGSGVTAPVLTINVHIAANKQGPVMNTATVSSVTDDPNPGNDTGNDTTTIGAEADLTATKQAQSSLTAGEPVTYRFEVTNNGGPSQANNVTITDNLQGHFTYQSFVSVSGGTWDCSESGGTVTCNLSTPLTAGSTAIVDVTLLVAQDAPNPTVNTAAVTFSGTDPSPANPSDSEPVAYEADLEVKLTHESETYHSGDTVKFTYTVINHGPSTAEDVALTDKLPEGLSFESIVASAPTTDRSVVANIVDTLLMSNSASAAPNTPFDCSVAGQDVTCDASSLSVGSYAITMTARIASTYTGNLASALQISSSTFDPNLSNNTSIDTIQDIQPASGLAGTGQNLFMWMSAAAIITAGAIMLTRFIMRKRTI